MQTLKCLFLFLLISVSVASAQPPVLGRVSVQGNKFVTADGQTIIFKGLDTSDPDKLAREGRWNREYFEEMKRWGANIVRFAVHPDRWRSRGKAEYLKLLDEGVEMSSSLGMYVIIDWHSIGNLRTEMFSRDIYETSRKETFEFWRTMASHFKDNPTVACFELFNEPTIESGKLGTCSWAEWKALMEEIIAIIRAHGATAIPLVAGFNWGYDLTPVAFDPINAEGIAYVSHPYPQKRNKPWEEQWTRDWGFVSKKYPVILTEIGFCGPDDRGAHIPVISDESYGDAITSYCAERGISYTVWVFDPHWSPMLFTDWNFTPSRQGRYWKAALQKKN